MGEVIHPTAPAGAREKWRKADGGVMNRAVSEYVAGAGSNALILPERGGAWSRVFLRATAGPATTL
ncbi:MAG: hypothetical protein AVW05_03455 [Hadesarchaea archaeon DG-33]|nr:MAG: hypothetical protein AVW05_03455 [Hadesarchaea archaeon DG-33]